MVLDGDCLRQGLCKDLDMSLTGREENIRRLAEVAKLFTDAGIIVITAFISPIAKDREAARAIIGAENFYEVYVNTSLACCEQRDVKGLYKLARQGKIKDFTGIDSPYQAPGSNALNLNSENRSVSDCVDDILAHCFERQSGV